MKQDKQKRNWIIDAVLFGGFLVALWLDLTGVAVHQWLGIAVGALAGYHLVAHWSWVKAVTGRLFGRTSRQSRQFYAVDAGLAVGFVTIAVTGLAISTWLDLSLASYVVWRNIHVLASVVTLALVVGKIGLHWRWIVSTARRRIFPAPAPAGQTGAVQPVPVCDPTGPAGLRAADGRGGGGGPAGRGERAQRHCRRSSRGGLRNTDGGRRRGPGRRIVGKHGQAHVSCAVGGGARTRDIVIGTRTANNNGRCDLGECLS